MVFRQSSTPLRGGVWWIFISDGKENIYFSPVKDTISDRSQYLLLFVCFETEDGNGSVAGVRLYQMTGYTHRSLGQRFGGR